MPIPTHAELRRTRRAATVRVRRQVGKAWCRVEDARPGAVRWSFDGYERVYLQHVRKTAGTSVSFAFMRLSGGDPSEIEQVLAKYNFAVHNGYRFAAHNDRLIRGGRYFFGQSHRPAYLSVPPAEGTFSFTVLRDPIKRVISLFTYLRDPEADRDYAFGALPSERARAARGFDEFIASTPRSDLLNQLYTFSQTGSVAEAEDRIRAMSAYLHTERLDAGIDGLGRSLGLQLGVERQRVSAASFTPTSAQLERLATVLEPELDLMSRL